MTAATKVELVGVDRLASTVGRAARDLGDMTAPGRTVAQSIARSARSRAPIRTGALAGSIDSEASQLAAQAWAGVEYARFVEYGPPRPQPFMGPALDEVAPDVEREYGDAVAKVISRVEGA